MNEDLSYKPYHINFYRRDLGDNPPKIALLSGEPERSTAIAHQYLDNPRLLSNYRGLNSYLGTWQNQPLLIATSGMGAPSLSIVVNELIQVGITQIIRLGTFMKWKQVHYLKWRVCMGCKH